MKKRLLLMFSLVFVMSFGCAAKSAYAEGEIPEGTGIPAETPIPVGAAIPVGTAAPIETNAPVGTDAPVESVEGVKTGIKISRPDGKCTFTVSGLSMGRKVTAEIADKTTGEVKYQKEYEALSETLSESITLEDLDYEYGKYSVQIKVDGKSIGEAKDCDFSIHMKKMDLSIAGESDDAKRTFSLNSTEKSDGVLVPGKGNKVSIYVWRSNEKDAEQIGRAYTIGGSRIEWGNISIASVKTAAYGTWNAKVVLKNAKSENITLASAKYDVKASAKALIVKKTAALEKEQKFRVQLKGAKSPYGANKVGFYIYTSTNKKLAAVAAVKSGSVYTADISYETVKYKLAKLTIKAAIFDKKGKGSTLSKTAAVDLSVKKGKLKIKKNKDVTCDYTLSGAYIPGNIAKVQFVLYVKDDGDLVKKKAYLANGSVSDNKYFANVPTKEIGSFTVYAYGYTAWGKKVQLASAEYEVKKSDLGKQGWYYEKVNGATYKFYYKDNEKVTDLTKILGLTKNGGNKMYIEVNRAACVVTFYLYDSETNKYDIPIKSAAVSVGRDTGTVAGAGALNVQSSFSPIGTYSICSNGAAVKYTLKPMHEPDGSTVYARWCSHIVGNVYFHAIAVGSQSHYALRSYSYNRLGSPASAGCIRMTVADAKWLYDYAPTGTTVKIVVGSSSNPGPFGKPNVIKINGVSYDPTDPEVPDATKKADYAAKKITGYMTKDGVKVGY